jgi:hypothetical protein
VHPVAGWAHGNMSLGEGRGRRQGGWRPDRVIGCLDQANTADATMIYIVTVHWRTPRWIEPQLAYLRRTIDEPYQVFGSLNDIGEGPLWDEFDYAEDIPGPHGSKLNQLADRVVSQGQDSDILLFLDSDAFPVVPVSRWLTESLEEYALVAIQRRENFGDLRPHPSFCATTIGQWRQLGGDWSRKPWTTPSGSQLDDAGTLVLEALEARGLRWLPLSRTNSFNPHPLFFGVYGHRIYHHGAGSRTKWSVVDDNKVFTDESLRSPSLGSLVDQLRADPQAWRRLRPQHLKVLPAATARSVRQVRKRVRLRSIEHRSERYFSLLATRPNFACDLDASIQVDDATGAEEPSR